MYCYLQEGGVFSFGAGGFGQLGHNSTQNEILPKRVMELMGSVISQVACGRLIIVYYYKTVSFYPVICQSFLYNTISYSHIYM